MTTLTQDYAALPGSADAAAHHARVITDEHLRGRGVVAEQVVRDLFLIGLAHTMPGGNLNLVTTAEVGHVRFELHHPDDVPDQSDPPMAHRTVSRLSDAYGDRKTATGRMIYAELGLRWAVTA